MWAVVGLTAVLVVGASVPIARLDMFPLERSGGSPWITLAGLLVLAFGVIGPLLWYLPARRGLRRRPPSTRATLSAIWALGTMALISALALAGVLLYFALPETVWEWLMATRLGPAFSWLPLLVHPALLFLTIGLAHLIAFVEHYVRLGRAEGERDSGTAGSGVQA